MTQNQHENSEAIRADIERTRGRMSEKIDRIQEQLSPENLKQQAQETVRGVVQDSTTALTDYVKANSNEMVSGLVDAVKHNPIPAALIGLGVGWLLIESMGQNDSGSSYDARYDRRRNFDAATGRSWQRADYDSADYYRPAYGYRGSEEPARFASQYYSGADINETNYGAASGAAGSVAYGATDYGATNYDAGEYRDNYNRYRNEQDEGQVRQGIDAAQSKARELGDRVSEGAEEARWRMQQAGNQAQQQAHEWQESAKSGIDQARQSAQQMADQARQQASNVGHQVQEYASYTREQLAHAGEGAQYYAQEAGVQLQRSLQDNPLIFGGIALGIGALLGLALPATQRENQLMGSTRDQVMESAQEVLHDAKDRAQHVAAEMQPKLEETVHKVADDLKQTGRTALQDVKESSKQAANELSGAVSEAGKQAKDEANQVANKAENEADKVKEQAKADARNAQQRVNS
jgi:ElaB/YqjD/DUF883 family membrane-anchored ribosome-binding protein